MLYSKRPAVRTGVGCAPKEVCAPAQDRNRISLATKVALANKVLQWVGQRHGTQGNRIKIRVVNLKALGSRRNSLKPRQHWRWRTSQLGDTYQ
jgi:hypothetical protein